ncbi:MAG: inorganic phosphate transporter [Oscillospiraceae bacterium]|jgi:PiT family inorganic phosphate transporter|nr:inorganic phosphate transporter [Oscillospiraceae bacterium]
MDLSLPTFLQNLSNPPFLIISLLVLGVVFVNGWTDAPNAIATAVSTRCIKPKAAIVMAAVFNLIGVLVMMLLSSAVADTISKMVDFGEVPQGSSSNPLLVAVCAAMFAIVVWAVAAWFFGIPTSESHALIAGLSGSALAMGGASGINWDQWVKVIYGIVLSTLLGFVLSFVLSKTVNLILKWVQNTRAAQEGSLSKNGADRFFTYGQNVAAAFMAFMHGAQDGQKFIGVFVLAMFVANSSGATEMTGSIGLDASSLWLIFLVAITMGVGTSIGGYRIIKTVGMDMVKLKKNQGFASDLAASVCLLISTFTGLPVSTTHTKTTAMMGAAVAKRPKSLNMNVVKEMFMAWFLTFPGCGLIAYLMTLLFSYLFG